MCRRLSSPKTRWKGVESIKSRKKFLMQMYKRERYIEVVRII
jgi:hypothetical protein